MERLYWEAFSFAPGVHTHHAWTEAGDIFARDMRNVRADENAYLRLRQPSGVFASAVADGKVTGVFATEGHLFFVVDGQLEVLDLDTDEQFDIVGDSDVSGRLWIVDAFGDFYIGKSEGTEQGFWVDIRDPFAVATTTDGDIPVSDAGDYASSADEYRYYPLGFDPPALPRLERGSVASQGLADGLYVYALTTVRAFFGDLDRVDLPPQVASKSFAGRDVLFNGMESNPRYFVVKVGGATGEVLEDGGVIQDVLALPSDNEGVKLSGVSYPDLGETGMYVYRTDVIASSFDRPREIRVEDLEFRVIDFLFRERPTDGAPDTIGTLHSAIDLSERPLMRKDNHRLPAEPAQIAYYNDLVFAAVGEVLRYSDVRDGAPVQWAWPAANAIRAIGEVVFCVEFRGVLLFGGPRGLWRLTGTDEFNFDRDRISAVGPVARGAFGVFEDGIGFIGAGGLYMTDGVGVTKVSSPYLDGYFETSEAVGGSVARLSNDDGLWAVRFETGAEFQFLRSARGGFFPWVDVDAVQFTKIAEQVLFVDGAAEAVQTIESVAKHDDAMAWRWLSQEIDFEEQGHAEALKTFKWLEVSSSHSGEGQLHVTVDGVGEERIHSFKFRGGAQRPVRVPIQRRGERIQLHIFGTGEVILRSMRLLAEVRSGRSRF